MSRRVALPPQRFPLTMPNELAGQERLGGVFPGPAPQTVAIWKGRVPLIDNVGPQGLALSAAIITPQPPAVIDLSRTVVVRAEGGTSNGTGQIREFMLGGGLSAELYVGSFQHVDVRVITPPGSSYIGIPAGVEVRFNWTYTFVDPSRLFLFRAYPVAAVVVAIPEGSEFVQVENACILTFAYPQFAGATFIRAAGAGERVPILGAALACNVVNDFVFEMRGF